MKIINGKKIAEKIKDNLIADIMSHCDILANGVRPNLAIALVGERPDSKLYVSLKEKEAKTIGIDTHLYKCEENISEDELLSIIECLNKDKTINGILIQLPLPKHLNTDKIIKVIDPNKDADGFHPENIKKTLTSGNLDNTAPVLYKVIFEILNEIKIKPKNKTIAILANSEIFGSNLEKLLSHYNPKQTIVLNTKDKELKSKTTQADILITAIGKPNFIKKDFIKKDSIIIDIGINKQKDIICGDVDLKDVSSKVKYITPVPGGVGPITIACLFENVINLYKKQNN